MKREEVLSILSWRNWGILRYNSIWQNITALFFIAFAERQFNASFLTQAVLFLLFSTVMTGFGYLINDLADRDLDRRHGKPNVFRHIRPEKAALIVLMVLFLGVLVALPFFSKEGFILVWSIWVLAAISYSLPPARLKERGAYGLAATVLAQQTIPTALLFTAFGHLFSIGALVFLVYATLRGLSSDISHQMRDWKRDSMTQTGTFAVRNGYQWAGLIYALSLELERLSLGGVVAMLLVSLPPLAVPWPGPQPGIIGIGLPLALIYLPLFLITIGRSLHAYLYHNLRAKDPYDEVRQTQGRDALHLIHHTFPSVLMPLYLSAWLTWFYKPYLAFVFILVLVYKLFSPALWAGVFPFLKRGSACVILLSSSADREEQVGKKAANLGRLMEAGLPVPPGFCVTLSAWKRTFQAANRDEKGKVRGVPGLTGQLLAAYHTLISKAAAGDKAVMVAVRSSSMKEDHQDKSFAGQFETILNVSDESGLIEAVERCWASQGSDRVTVYRRGSDVGDLKPGEGMAVLVQVMVRAEMSGVLFTSDPIAAKAERLVIEVTSGLGDSLVSGIVRPARVIFNKKSRHMLDTLEGGGLPFGFSLSIDWSPLLEMAQRAEEILGPRLDLEWAYQDGQFWLLQARPITGLSLPPIEQGLTRANIGEVLPGVISPLAWSTFLTALKKGEHPNQDPRPSEMAVLLNGRAYIHLQRLWDSYSHILGVDPAVVLTTGIGCALKGHQAQLKQQTAPLGVASRLMKSTYVWGELLTRQVERRRLQGLISAQIQPQLSIYQKEDLTQMAAADLWQEISDLLGLSGKAFMVHMRTSFIALASFGAAWNLLVPHLGSEQVMPLLAAVQADSESSGQFQQKISFLAEQVKKSPELNHLFSTQRGSQLVQALKATKNGQSFLDKVLATTSDLGDRGIGEFDVRASRWSEQIELLLTAVAVAADEIVDGDALSSLSPVEPFSAVRAQLSQPRRWLSGQTLRTYQMYSGLREDTKKRLSACFGELRRRYVILGQRLVAYGLIDQAGQIFFLNIDELSALLKGRAPERGYGDRIAERQIVHRRNEVLAFSFQSGAAPDNAFDRSVYTPEGERVLKGTAVSAGSVTGKARIIIDPTKIILKEGEILVAKAADPGWLPHFMVSAAIVAELGGMLSHTATLARELHKPAVFSVPGATRQIRDGDWITVDGTHGRVLLHGEKEPVWKSS